MTLPPDPLLYFEPGELYKVTEPFNMFPIAGQDRSGIVAQPGEVIFLTTGYASWLPEDWAENNVPNESYSWLGVMFLYKDQVCEATIDFVNRPHAYVVPFG